MKCSVGLTVVWACCWRTNWRLLLLLPGNCSHRLSVSGESQIRLINDSETLFLPEQPGSDPAEQQISPRTSTSWRHSATLVRTGGCRMVLMVLMVQVWVFYTQPSRKWPVITSSSVPPPSYWRNRPKTTTSWFTPTLSVCVCVWSHGVKVLQYCAVPQYQYQCVTVKLCF